MNRPQQVRAVFQELRQTVGDQFSAGELLARASALVDLFTVNDDPFRREPLEDRPPFEEWSLDVTMADGGWRILDRVYREDHDLFDWQAGESMETPSMSDWLAVGDETGNGTDFAIPAHFWG